MVAPARAACAAPAGRGRAESSNDYTTIDCLCKIVEARQGGYACRASPHQLSPPLRDPGHLHNRATYTHTRHTPSTLSTEKNARNERSGWPEAAAANRGAGAGCHKLPRPHLDTRRSHRCCWFVDHRRVTGRAFPYLAARIKWVQELMSKKNLSVALVSDTTGRKLIRGSKKKR